MGTTVDRPVKPLIAIMNSQITIHQSVNKKQSGLLLAFTGHERVRIWHDWYHISELVDGQLVDEITYLGQFSLKVGDNIRVGKGAEIDEVEVLQIRYAQSKKLAKKDISELGYRSLEEYTKSVARSLPEYVWYIAFDRIDESSFTAPREAKVLNDVLTAQEAASLFDLSESTIRVNIHRGKVPARKSGGTWLIRRTDAERKWSR